VLTDERYAELTAALAGFDPASYGDEFEQTFEGALEQIEQMEAHRADVDALSIPASEGLGYYTRMNASMLGVIAHIGGLSDNAELSRLIAAYVNFLQGKERAGQERGLMSTVLAKGHFEGAQFNTFSQIVTEQDTYHRVFESFATAEQIAFYNETVSGDGLDAVNGMRAIAFDGANAESLGVDGAEWFDAMTVKINLLKTVENRLADDLVTRAHDLRSSAQSTLIQLAVLVTLLTLFSVGAAVVVARGLSSQIHQLADGLRSLATGSTKHQLEVHSSDEVGEMADSYRELQAYLVSMAGTARRIADGDLSVEVRPKGSDDELGNAFATMTSNLNAVLADVSTAAESLDASRAELGRIANDASRATLEVANSIGQVAEGSSEQANSVQATTESIKHLSGAIGQVNEGASRQSGSIDQVSALAAGVAEAASQVSSSGSEASDAAAKAVSTAAEGAEKVRGTVAGIERIKEKVDAASEEIATLGARSAEIGKIVATIDDIAAQTNLLALNAAIEAARAGEQGRGFAVVADEVRQLAERVTTSTQEIAGLIEGVQAGVDASVSAMNEGAAETEAGTVAAAAAGESIEGIISAVDAVTKQIGEISSQATSLGASGGEMARQIEEIRQIADGNAEAANGMAEIADEVAESMTSIAAVSEENSAASEEVSATAEEMTAQVEQITVATERLGEMSQTLRDRISTFTLAGTRAQLEVIGGAEHERPAA
jgi:methyl-accepting chemotaxis protein